MQQSQEIDQLAAALVKAQSEFPAVAKDATAEVKSTKGSYSYTYATLPDVQRAVLPVLSANGLMVTQGTVDEDSAGFTIETILIHQSGQWLALRVRVPISNETAQAAGSGFAYGRRIGLVGALGIITDDHDDDGEKATTAGPKRESKPTAIVMPGKPDKWGGNGGKPLAEVPTSALGAFVGWCEADPDRSGKFRREVEAAVAILEERREQGEAEADPMEPI